MTPDGRSTPPLRGPAPPTPWRVPGHTAPHGCSGFLSLFSHSILGGARHGGQLAELSTGLRRYSRWVTAEPKAIHTPVVWMGRLSTACS